MSLLVKAKWADFESQAPPSKLARTEDQQSPEDKKIVSDVKRNDQEDSTEAVVVIKRLPEEVVRKYTRRASREREFFVKWKDHSYWHCSWVTEIQLDVYEPRKLLMYKSRTDMDQPPACLAKEDLEDEVGEDPLGLYDRFYKWGVRPMWLQVQRVINHQEMSCGTVYYVKWKGLPYIHCSWEDKYTGIPDLEPRICDYEDLRHICGYGPKRKRSRDKNHNSQADNVKAYRFSPPPKKPTRNLDKPYKE